MSSQVKVGVGVFVYVNGKGVLFLKRTGSHGAGEWSFPGGKMECCETVLECAAREVLEETGLILQCARIIPTFTEDRFPDFGEHYITLYVIGTADGEPTILEPEKASEMCFVDLLTKTPPKPSFVGVDKIWDKRYAYAHGWSVS